MERRLPEFALVEKGIMINKNILVASLFSCCCLSISASVFAQDSTGGKFYVLGQVGSATLETDETDFDDSDTFFGAGVGYYFSDNLAVEGSYYDYGEGYDLGHWAYGTSLTVSAVGIIPLADRGSFFGKAGIDVWDGTKGGVDDNGTDIYLAVGGSYSVMENLHITGEFQFHQWGVTDDDMYISVFSVGVRWIF